MRPDRLAASVELLHRFHVGAFQLQVQGIDAAIVRVDAPDDRALRIVQQTAGMAGAGGAA